MRKRFADIVPVELGWSQAGDMEVVWSDEHRSRYTPAYLRSICPCADCTGSHGTTPKAFNIVASNKLVGAHKQTVITSVEPMGNYAVCFTWGDGHKDGIYSWSFLRQSCPEEVRSTQGESTTP